MSFAWHGNWCGPGYSGGQFTQNQDMSELDQTAVDELDELCRSHDYAVNSATTREQRKLAHDRFVSAVEKLPGYKPWITGKSIKYGAPAWDYAVGSLARKKVKAAKGRGPLDPHTMSSLPDPGLALQVQKAPRQFWEQKTEPHAQSRIAPTGFHYRQFGVSGTFNMANGISQNFENIMHGTTWNSESRVNIKDLSPSTLVQNTADSQWYVDWNVNNVLKQQCAVRVTYNLYGLAQGAVSVGGYVAFQPFTAYSLTVSGTSDPAQDQIVFPINLNSGQGVSFQVTCYHYPQGPSSASATRYWGLQVNNSSGVTFQWFANHCSVSFDWIAPVGYGTGANWSSD